MRRLSFVVEVEVTQDEDAVNVRAVLRSGAHGVVLGHGVCSAPAQYFRADDLGYIRGELYHAVEAAYVSAIRALAREVKS